MMYVAIQELINQDLGPNINYFYKYITYILLLFKWTKFTTSFFWCMCFDSKITIISRCRV